MFTNNTGRLSLVKAPGVLTSPVERNAGRPAVITPDIQRFASPLAAKREDVTVPLNQIKTTRQKITPFDPERLADAAKAAVELSVISQIPLKDRSPNLTQRVAGLQALLRSTSFSSKEEFQRYQQKAQSDFTNRQLQFQFGNALKSVKN
jgi:hypothetical protein